MTSIKKNWGKSTAQPSPKHSIQFTKGEKKKQKLPETVNLLIVEIDWKKRNGKTKEGDAQSWEFLEGSRMCRLAITLIS